MTLQDKKILVTGSTGFLGSNIVEKLIVRGIPRKNIFLPRSNDLDLRIWGNCLQAVRGINVVIHAAGMTGGGLFHKERPAEIFYSNLVMGIHLMEAARQAGVEKFVTVGSATEYPEHAPLPFREADIWSGRPESLHMAYTVAKRMLLVQSQAYRAQYGMNSIHLIMTNMYGPGDEREGGGFVIPMLIKKVYEAKIAGADFFGVWGTGSATRDFLYVEDAAEGVITAVEKYDKPDPVNIGSGWEVSIRELAGLIACLMEFKGEIRFDAEKPEGQKRRMLDTTYAEKELGFKAMTDIETGIRKTIERFQNNHKNVRSPK